VVAIFCKVPDSKGPSEVVGSGKGILIAVSIFWSV